MLMRRKLQRINIKVVDPFSMPEGILIVPTSSNEDELLLVIIKCFKTENGKYRTQKLDSYYIQKTCLLKVIKQIQKRFRRAIKNSNRPLMVDSMLLL